MKRKLVHSIFLSLYRHHYYFNRIKLKDRKVGRNEETRFHVVSAQNGTPTKRASEKLSEALNYLNLSLLHLNVFNPSFLFICFSSLFFVCVLFLYFSIHFRFVSFTLFYSNLKLFRILNDEKLHCF